MFHLNVVFSMVSHTAALFRFIDADNCGCITAALVEESRAAMLHASETRK